MAGLGIVGTIASHRGNRCCNLCEKIQQNGHIAHAVAGDLNRSDFERLSINPQMYLAPLASAIWIAASL